MPRRIALAVLAATALLSVPTAAEAHMEACAGEWGLRTSPFMPGLGGTPIEGSFDIRLTVGACTSDPLNSVGWLSGEIAGVMGYATGAGTAWLGSASQPHGVPFEFVWVAGVVHFMGGLRGTLSPVHGNIVGELYTIYCYGSLEVVH
jgi:hypothetical protein